MNEEYTCYQCGGEFLRCRSDEEAMEEHHQNIEGAVKNLDGIHLAKTLVSPIEIVCDDCYQDLKKKHGWLK